MCISLRFDIIRRHSFNNFDFFYLIVLRNYWTTNFMCNIFRERGIYKSWNSGPPTLRWPFRQLGLLITNGVGWLVYVSREVQFFINFFYQERFLNLIVGRCKCFYGLFDCLEFTNIKVSIDLLHQNAFFDVPEFNLI